jgi:uncharacterized protein (TIGR03437 family)
MIHPLIRSFAVFAVTLFPATAQIVVKPDPPLPNAVVGAPYTVKFTASNGYAPYTYSIASGALPAGLTLNAGAGAVDGAPASEGVFVFALKAADYVNASVTRTYSITVKPALTITTPTPLANGSARASYILTFSAAGGWPPYTWSAGSGLPVGLTLNPASGVLSGIPTATGNFTFSIRVTDSSQFSTSKTFSLTIQNASPLQTSVGSLAFSAWDSGDGPLAQSFLVTAADQSAVRFSIQLDGGAANTPAPSWISVQPRTGVTPARVSVTLDSSALRAASYSARVLVVSADGAQTIPLPVTFTVEGREPRLEVIPNYLRLTAPGQPAGPTETTLLIRNSGGQGAIRFQVSTFDTGNWLTVEPSSGTTSPNSYTLLRVGANPLVLERDAYRGAVRISSDAGTVDVPVAFLVPDSGPALGVSYTGVRFDVRQSQGVSNTQSVGILNIGDDTVNWTAELVAGQEWLTLGATTGQAAAGSPGSLSLSANPRTLEAGRYYGVVRITDPQSLNSPQYVTAVLNLLPANATLAPELSPGGLVFTAVAGASAPLRQTLRLFASSATPVPFQTSVTISDGGGWLTADPASGQVSATGTAQINVTANPANLKPGVYTAEVTVSLAGVIRAASVTFIVTPAATSAAPKPSRSAAGCAPARLSLTSTGLTNLFNVPAAWPQPLSVRLADDCGSPVPDAQVVATFSNGDPPLALKLSDSQTGIYSGTWLPGGAASPATMVVRAAATGFAVGSMQLDGAVMVNQAPVLNVNGTVNTFNPVTAAPLAPGTIVQILGSRLATADRAADAVPLPVTVAGVTVLAGGLTAPLFAVSANRIDAQLPAELTPGRQYQVVVNSGNAFTLPDTINVTAVRPGVSASAAGQAVAQHADSSPVTETAPAKPGELITLFLAGMGATDTAVASGQASPGNPPASALAQPQVVLDDRPVDVLFAGLSPGQVGLYSINVRVPADMTAGNRTLQITQNGIAANTTTLPVGP